jgi:PPOX class probable F420-dependent enzyme
MSLTSEHEKMLTTEVLGWLTTVNGDQPQSSPVGYLWSDGALWVRSEPTQWKVRNVAGNPLVSFHLDQRDRRVVSMECRAARVDRFPDDVRAQYNEKYEATAAAMGSTVEALEAKFSACLHLDPMRVRAW